MREDYDAFKAGWDAAAAEMERRCIKVWYPNNEFGWAVPQGEIVQLRSMVTTTKEDD